MLGKVSDVGAGLPREVRAGKISATSRSKRCSQRRSNTFRCRRVAACANTTVRESSSSSARHRAYCCGSMPSVAASASDCCTAPILRFALASPLSLSGSAAVCSAIDWTNFWAAGLSRRYGSALRPAANTTGPHLMSALSAIDQAAMS